MTHSEDEPIKMATLSIYADGYITLRYHIANGTMVASLGTYHLSDAQMDFESTQRIEGCHIKASTFNDMRRHKILRPTWFK